MSGYTVSLVRRDVDGDVAAYCTGVWVAPDAFLTAAHCVRGEDFVQFITREIEPQMYEEPAALFAGSVRARDIEHDLALVDASYPAHAHARLAASSPEVGEDITVIGSTVGMTWSVSGGNVAAYRIRLPMSDNVGPLMQLSASVYYGNSGGPVFDTSGDLVGIVVEKTSAPCVALAVHLSAVRAFLIKQGV